MGHGKNEIDQEFPLAASSPIDQEKKNNSSAAVDLSKIIQPMFGLVRKKIDFFENKIEEVAKDSPSGYSRVTYRGADGPGFYYSSSESLNLPESDAKNDSNEKIHSVSTVSDDRDNVQIREENNEVLRCCKESSPESDGTGSSGICSNSDLPNKTENADTKYTENLYSSQENSPTRNVTSDVIEVSSNLHSKEIGVDADNIIEVHLAVPQIETSDNKQKYEMNMVQKQVDSTPDFEQLISPIKNVTFQTELHKVIENEYEKSKTNFGSPLATSSRIFKDAKARLNVLETVHENPLDEYDYLQGHVRRMIEFWEDIFEKTSEDTPLPCTNITFSYNSENHVGTPSHSPCSSEKSPNSDILRRQELEAYRIYWEPQPDAEIVNSVQLPVNIENGNEDIFVEIDLGQNDESPLVEHKIEVFVETPCDNKKKNKKKKKPSLMSRLRRIFVIIRDRTRRCLDYVLMTAFKVISSICE